MMEIFKDIEGYEGLYQISDQGRVKSLNYNGTGKERIMKPCNNGGGYLYIGLWNLKNGKQKWFLVHRLVAQAFIPNPDNLPFINHRDECKTNNHVDNLEWCSHQYNVNYGTGIQRMKGKKSKTVYQYSLDGEFIREWPSTMEIHRQTGYSYGNISSCCRSERPTAYGYIWRY